MKEIPQSRRPLALVASIRVLRPLRAQAGSLVEMNEECLKLNAQTVSFLEALTASIQHSFHREPTHGQIPSLVHLARALLATCFARTDRVSDCVAAASSLPPHWDCC
jgi:hypothetical protein